MPTGTAHIPNDGSGMARRLRDVERALQREGAAQRVAAVSALTPWQDLLLSNGWSIAGDPWAKPQARRQADGAVQLIGSIVPGTLANGTVIATLPPDLAPANALEFRISGGAITAAVDLTVTGDGAITIEATAGTVARLSLTQICLPQ